MPDRGRSAIDVILGRRSIRKFISDTPVPKEDIRLILSCACAAPSAANRRPWHFILTDDRETLKKISEIHPYSKMLDGAAFAIVVCGEKERGGKELLWWEEECSAAMQNILLSCEALGLGAVWLGVRHGADSLEERIKALLEIPDFAAVLGIAAAGWPAETKDPHSGIDPASLHINKW